MRLVFDRGTILFLDTERPKDIACLPGVLWDSRVGGFRCPARLHGDLVSTLRQRRVAFSDEVAAAPDELLQPGQPIELRPYQEAALAAWDLAGRRGTIVLPTGAGKTRVAIAAIMRSRATALCLVPTCVLLDQWVRAIEEIAKVAPGRVGDGEYRIGQITVATFESGWRHMDRLGNRFTLLVVDEVHHFGHGMRDEALEMNTAPLRLGLTATPPGAAGAARLGDLVGPTVYELALGDLAGSFLAPFDIVVLHLDLSPEERTQHDQFMGVFREIFSRFRRFHPHATWNEFARSAGKTDDGRRAIAAWMRARRLLSFPRAKRHMLGTLLARHRDAKTIVFTADNSTAYEIAREHMIMPLTCDIGRKERERSLELFKEGKLRALVSAQVLNEGLDVPEAEVGIVVGASRGVREHVQRVGRVLRPRPGKRALVYEFVVRGTAEIEAGRRRRGALAA